MPKPLLSNINSLGAYIFDHFLRIVAYTPPLLMVASFIMAIWLYSLQHLNFFIGTTNLECSCYFLKQWLKIPRPEQAGKIRSSYGMPSSHSAFVGYLWMLFYLEMPQITENSYTNHWLYLLFIWGCIVIYSRFYFKHHTVFQLLCGVVYGLLIAFIWDQIQIK